MWLLVKRNILLVLLMGCFVFLSGQTSETVNRVIGGCSISSDANCTISSVGGALNFSNVPAGNLYEDNETGSVITVTTAGTYYQWVTTTAGLSSGGLVLSTATDNITVPAAAAGTYLVIIRASFLGTVNSTMHLAVFVNGVVLPQLRFERKVGAGSDVGTGAASGLATVGAGQTIDLRVTSDGNGNTLTIHHGGLTAIRIGP